MEEKKKVCLTIDGEYVQIEQGLPLIEAAKKLNIFIPTLCYHESLKAYGACRLCMVEVIKNKRSRLVTSCNYPAEEGLEVFTDSIKVRKIREIIFRLLLARCQDVPLIKKMAKEMDIEATKFKKREDNQCILCGLCVRTCEEIVGTRAIGFNNRGIEREVSTPFKVDSDICIGCGACSFVCPTGCIEMVNRNDAPSSRYMKMGDLSLDICPNSHQCESCEIDHQFSSKMKQVIAEFRSKPSQ